MVLLIISVRKIERKSYLSHFLYLHCVFIDQEFLNTITMTIVGDVIHHYEEKIHIGTYVRIENFGIKRKHAGEF